ncbi:hypothetical protein LJK88_41265 [Paenibacillus sp. P26]|nr:hypothetical protein LJK88_41265 [Paenibacillus sp. P26]
MLTTVAGTNPTTRVYTYSYKLKMDLDIHTTDEAVADPANPKLYMQLENGNGIRLASKSFPLSGDGRLLSGTQTINFDSASDQMESPLTLKIYESISTPYGEARRLLSELKE